MDGVRRGQMRHDPRALTAQGHILGQPSGQVSYGCQTMAELVLLGSVVHGEKTVEGQVQTLTRFRLNDPWTLERTTVGSGRHGAG